MPNLGGTELLILFVILLLIFGANRLPKLARSLGEARRELRDPEDDVERQPESRHETAEH
jgi:sec-independent protein translocase protein TatA